MDNMVNNTMHRKLYEHVEEAIGVRIIKGEYKTSDTLPNEEALCAEFGVSRGVIREAIKVLNKKGLVLPRPKIGTQIQPKNQWNLFDADILVWKLKAGKQLGFLKKVTEVRRIVESEAAKLSAERAAKEEYVEIQKLCNQLGNILNDESEFNYDVFNPFQHDKPDQLCELSAVTESALYRVSHCFSHTAIVVGGDAGKAVFEISRSVVDHIAVGGPLE